jgi:hypothetical protein
MAKTELVISLQVPGFHRWKDAPLEYSYLSNWHRHVFHINCYIEVKNDRQFEFIVAKDSLMSFLKNTLGAQRIIPNTGIDDPSKKDYADMFLHRGHLVFTEDVVSSGSCEGIAEYIAGYLKGNYGKVTVEVLEDGENGARVTL